MPQLTNECFVPSANRAAKRLQVALPLRITYWDEQNRAGATVACTYDISSRGARITGLPEVKEVGEIIAVERGRNKVFCRVVWVADSKSVMRRQIGIEAVECERFMWESELRDLDDLYDPIFRGWTMWRTNAVLGESERRQHPRLAVEGKAKLTNQGPNTTQIEGQLRDLSEYGCLITPQRTLIRGTELKVVLNVGEFDIGLKGQVRHVSEDQAAGIQFREIRKGDRDRLQYLLRQVAERQFEDSFLLDSSGVGKAAAAGAR